MPGESSSHDDAGNPQAPHPDWRRTLAVLGIMVASFAFLETAVLPAIPTIQRQMHTAGTTMTALLLSGFLIVAAVAAPLIGKLGDQRGKKRMLLIALTVYFIGAIGAAAAPNFPILIIFRACQGVGGAIMSLSFAIIRDEAHEKLSVAIGWIIGCFGIGASAGLGLSGVITEALSWRYLFAVEAVLILTGICLIYFLIPASPRCQTNLKVDYASVGLLGCGLACLIMGLSEVPNLHWGSAGLFAAAGVLLAGWIYHEQRTDHPLLKVSVLTSPRILLANIGSALAGYVLFSTFVLIPRLVQAPSHLPPPVAQRINYGFDAGVVQVGLYLLPVGIGILFAGPTGGIVGRRYGGKWPFALGLALLVPASALLAAAHGNRYQLVAWLFLLGIGFGLSTGASGVFVTQTVKPEFTAVATAFNSLSRLIAGGIGSQVAALIIKSQTLPGTSAPTNTAFTIAFIISAGMALIAAVISLFIPAGDPQES